VGGGGVRGRVTTFAFCEEEKIWNADFGDF